MLFTEHAPQETKEEYAARMELEIIRIEITQSEETLAELKADPEKNAEKIEEVEIRLKKLHEKEQGVMKKLPKNSRMEE